MVFVCLMTGLNPAWGQTAQQRRIGSLNLGDLERLDITRPAEQARLMEARNTELLGDGAVDPDTYILGPGDLLGLEILGAISLSAEDVIGADGNATFPQLGTFMLGGLTLSDARAQLKEQGSGLVRGGKVELLLKTLRTFKVFVTGRVSRPGSVRAAASTRVSEVILMVGGFKGGADSRNIEIIHRDGSKEYADLLPFLVAGDLEKNRLLIDGDVIRVQPRTDTIDFSGPVLFPGVYDFVEGDELGALLELFGFHPSANLTRATIQRYSSAVKWDTLSVDLGTVIDGVANVPLRRGDRIMFRSIPTWHLGATATIRGAVKSPGQVPVVRGALSVGAAIRLAGGLLEGAVPERVILGRPFLPDSTQVVDPSPLRNYVQGLTAQRLHEVIVDLTRGDGPTVDPGDVITVPLMEGWVEVLGQVKHPGYYTFYPEWKTRDYIEAAGGFAKLADKSKSRISRGRFGDVGYVEDVERPAPGDLIWVPEKLAFNFWVFARDFFAVTSQAVALVLVLRETIK